jgi:UDP-N-acetylmuramoyl-tripeptide--D-alanyl-D-alanine ligase
MADFIGATFDSREVTPGMLFVALKGENADGHDFIEDALKKGAVGIVDGIDELASIASQYRNELKAKVIAVTGSAGKTTTKELLKAFLSTVGKVHATDGNFNNHIGLPITILNCPKDADYLVLEMGSNHPGEIAHLCSIAKPDAGVITNIGTAHLEFFGDKSGIAREKSALFSSLSDSATAIVADNVDELDLIRKLSTPPLTEVDTTEMWIEGVMEGVLPGEHNVANAALAFKLAEKFGVTKEGAIKSLENFSLPGSRWKKRIINGVTYIDDTYNASPDSMMAALKAFSKIPCEGKRVAVLGDMFELGENALELHKKVFDYALRLGIELVIGVGEYSSQCLCNLAYKSLTPLKKKFRVDVSSGDLVLLKASHAMKLGELLDCL